MCIRDRDESVVVVEGFSRAHDDHIGHPLPGELLDSIHLGQHFPHGQVPHQTADAGGAEFAAHATAHLGRNTDVYKRQVQGLKRQFPS